MYKRQAGEVDRFIFGFEESYGYLAGPYVRDKDAIIGSMLICEMAAYYPVSYTHLDVYKRQHRYCQSSWKAELRDFSASCKNRVKDKRRFGTQIFKY